jgi:hypothetical protein
MLSWERAYKTTFETICPGYKPPPGAFRTKGKEPNASSAQGTYTHLYEQHDVAHKAYQGQEWGLVERSLKRPQRKALRAVASLL